MTRVFPEIMKRFAFWLDMANFAAGVVTWATTGATIGSIIPGVGTAVGAVVGAAIGLVVGFWDLTKKKIEDDNYSKTQTQELAKKTLDKKKGADDIEKNLKKSSSTSRKQTKERRRSISRGNVRDTEPSCCPSRDEGKTKQVDWSVKPV